jgi:hypothetical protein
MASEPVLPWVLPWAGLHTAARLRKSLTYEMELDLGYQGRSWTEHGELGSRQALETVHGNNQSSVQRYFC